MQVAPPGGLVQTLADPNGFQVGDGVRLVSKDPYGKGTNIIQRTLIASSGNRFKLDRRLEERFHLEGDPKIATNFALLQCTDLNLIRDNDIRRSGEAGIHFRGGNKSFAPHRNRIEGNRIVDSDGEKGIAIDINGETESVIVSKNEIRETRGPGSRIGILIGAGTRDIRSEDNRIDGFAIPLSDLRKK